MTYIGTVPVISVRNSKGTQKYYLNIPAKIVSTKKTNQTDTSTSHSTDEQLRLPFSPYVTLTYISEIESNGIALYGSIIVTVTRRFYDGLDLTTSTQILFRMTLNPPSPQPTVDPRFQTSPYSS